VLLSNYVTNLPLEDVARSNTVGVPACTHVTSEVVAVHGE